MNDDSKPAADSQQRAQGPDPLSSINPVMHTDRDEATDEAPETQDVRRRDMPGNPLGPDHPEPVTPSQTSAASASSRL